MTITNSNQKVSSIFIKNRIIASVTIMKHNDNTNKIIISWPLLAGHLILFVNSSYFFLLGLFNVYRSYGPVIKIVDIDHKPIIIIIGSSLIPSVKVSRYRPKTGVSIESFLFTKYISLSLYLQEGLVIIDTPGFGDNHMHKSLNKYLTKSCGFIYVVNTANAGGVQRGRVRFSNK